MENRRPAGLSGVVPAVQDVLAHALCEPGLALLTDEAVLGLLSETDRLVSLAEATRARVIRECERREAADVAHCTTAEFLRRGLAHSIQRCRSLVKTAVREGRFPLLVEAVADGRVAGEQGGVIARLLDELPAELAVGQVELAQETMIGLAAEFGPAELQRLGWHLLEVIAPERSDEILADKLARDEAEARRKRGLSLASDGHGTMHLRGRLPISDGEELATVLQAYAESRWRALADDEAGAETLPKDKSLLWADALMDLVRAHQAGRQAPAHGGDRPRVVVLLRLEALARGLGEMALSSGAPLSATEARRLACDCDLTPMVLNAEGVPLDVGRTHRLVTPAIRAALMARDGGCVSPGCDRGASLCEAHHIRPWWAGGVTGVDNLVLLCPRHHRRVEPGRGQAWNVDDPHRWQVRLGADRLPDIIPPVGYDPERKVLRHARFRVLRR